MSLLILIIFLFREKGFSLLFFFPLPFKRKIILFLLPKEKAPNGRDSSSFFFSFPFSFFGFHYNDYDVGGKDTLSTSGRPRVDGMRSRPIGSPTPPSWGWSCSASPPARSPSARTAKNGQAFQKKGASIRVDGEFFFFSSLNITFPSFPIFPTLSMIYISRFFFGYFSPFSISTSSLPLFWFLFLPYYTVFIRLFIKMLPLIDN